MHEFFSPGYVIFYTTDSSQRDRDWVVEGVVGDKMTTTIKGLTPDTAYFIKIQARNNKGYGPFSSIIQFRTNPSTSFSISILSFFLFLFFPTLFCLLMHLLLSFSSVLNWFIIIWHVPSVRFIQPFFFSFCFIPSYPVVLNLGNGMTYHDSAPVSRGKVL